MLTNKHKPFETAVWSSLNSLNSNAMSNLKALLTRNRSQV